MPTLEDKGGGKWKIYVQCGGTKRTKTFRASGPRERDRLAAHWETELRRDYTAAREARSTETPAELRRRVAQLEAELAEYRAVQAADASDPGRVAFGVVVAAWFEFWQGRKLAATTRSEYRRLIRERVLTSPLAGMQIRHIHAGDIDEWYQALVAGGLSPSSVRQIHAIVRQVFAYAARKGIILANPAEDAELPKMNRRRKAMPDTEDVIAVLAAAADTDEMRGRVLRFAALTGLRRSEVCGLRWSRLDLDRGRATIDTAVVSLRGDDDDKWVLKPPKSGQDDWIGLRDDVVAIVRVQLAWQLERFEQWGGPPVKGDDPFLWGLAAPFHRPLRPDTLTHWHMDACKAAGVTGLRLHDLRHWHASALAAGGVPLTEVQAALRHRSLVTTLNYAHASDDTAVRREAVSRLPSLELGP